MSRLGRETDTFRVKIDGGEKGEKWIRREKRRNLERGKRRELDEDGKREKTWDNEGKEEIG